MDCGYTAETVNNSFENTLIILLESWHSCECPVKILRGSGVSYEKNLLKLCGKQLELLGKVCVSLLIDSFSEPHNSHERNPLGILGETFRNSVGIM